MGIGREVSRQLAHGGARVVIAAQGAEAIAETLDGLEGSGHLGLQLDVSDAAAWPAVMEMVDRSGPSEGSGVRGGHHRSSWQVRCGLDRRGHRDPRCQSDRDASGTAPRGAASGTVRWSCGRILRGRCNVTTPQVRRIRNFEGGCGSVGGEHRRTTAVEINCVAPGFVATRMHQATLEAGPESAGAAYYARTREQLGAGGFPASEAAALVGFLLSDDAAGITGRLLSAQWDPWRDPAFRARLRDDPNLARLRRIDDQQFSANG